MVIAAVAISLLAQGWVEFAHAPTSMESSQHDPVVRIQGYPRAPSREEMDWRRRHQEIPGYAPYTPGYGPYIEDGHPRWQGTRNPYYREEYPRIEYPRVYRCWRDGPC